MQLSQRTNGGGDHRKKRGLFQQVDLHLDPFSALGKHLREDIGESLSESLFLIILDLEQARRSHGNVAVGPRH